MGTDISHCCVVFLFFSFFFIPKKAIKNPHLIILNQEQYDKETWKQKHNLDIPRAGNESVKSRVSKVETTAVF